MTDDRDRNDQELGNREEQARRLAAEMAALSVYERQETLHKLDQSDSALREAVEKELAQNYLAAGDALTQATAPAFDLPRRQLAATGEVAGQSIGRYKLLQELGAGGFGIVWLAEQREPVARKVALKVVKLGMDTREVLARFEAERQVLALLEHPNIAKVFDAGMTAGGRPYFVMELCRGLPISEYCDRHRLSVTERLELFSQVCMAVQHAHQKGIIHRDIKPSNILVSEVDGKATPKVIDFGIAKITVGSLHSAAEVTQQQSFIGTPEYMSPEQAAGDLDIDTRTDVYALGVLLYALLTGTTPFPSRELRAAAQLEMQRIIREVEPPKPSTRIAKSGDTIANVAAARSVEPAQLSSLIRGELDWIVMRSMEKERTRRYDSASALALDVRRYLSGEAVYAAPPSNVYLARKFVTRNRALVTATAAVAAALVLGVVAFAWQASLARQQRDLAIAAREAETTARAAADAQRDRAVAAEAQTQLRASELKKVSDFQEQMLAGLDPASVGVALSNDVQQRYRTGIEREHLTPDATKAKVDAFNEQWRLVAAGDAVRELLDASILRPAVTALDRQFADQPLLDARLRNALAERYNDIGLTTRALELRHDVLKTRRLKLGETHPETLSAMFETGFLLRQLDQLKEAEELLRPALDAALKTLGPDDRLTLRIASEWASLLANGGKLAEAETAMRDAFQRQQKTLGPEDAFTLQTENNLNILLQDEGKLDEAEPLAREVLAIRRRVLGPAHRDTIIAIGNLGTLLQDAGKTEEAEGCYREVVENRRQQLGAEHPSTLSAMANLGSCLRAEKKYDAAEAILRECLAGSRAVLGPSHRETLKTLNSLGFVLLQQKRLEEGEACWREAVETGQRTLGANHPEVLIWVNNLAGLLRDRGKFAESEALYRQARVGFRQVRGEKDFQTLSVRLGLSRTLIGAGKFAEAEADLLALEAIITAEPQLPPSLKKRTVGTLMELYEAWNKKDKTHAAEADTWRKKFTAIP